MNALLETFGDRLISLSTGAIGLRTQLGVTVLLDDADPDLMTIRASDQTLDRYNEIIAAAGWRTKNYERNPVIQNAHQCGDIIHTIGRAVRTWVEDNALMQIWKFASTENPVAKVARYLYRGRYLNAASVSFIPDKWENGTEHSGFSRKYTSQDLIEVSAVGIPANPNALALAIKSGAVEPGDLKELARLLKHFCNDQEDLRSDARATGPEADFAHLLPLARAAAIAAKRA